MENEMLSMGNLLFQGGQNSILAVDLGPWMSASIIIQLSNLAAGRRKKGASSHSMNRQIRGIAFCFACLSASVRSITMVSEKPLSGNLYIDRGFVAIVLVAGCFLVIWMAEQNKEKGIGGMISFILLNILFNLIRIFIQMISMIRSDNVSMEETLLIISCILILSFLGAMITVKLEHKKKKLPVQRVLIDSSLETENYLAIKANPVGAQAMMYVMALYMLPYYLLRILNAVFPTNNILRAIIGIFNLYHPVGILIYVVLYLFVAVSLAYVQINPADLSRQMQKRGDCLRGYCPGKETEQIIRSIVLRNSLQSGVLFAFIIGISLGLRIWIPAASDSVMIPIYIMIFTGISQNILEEIRSVYSLEHYEELIKIG